MMDNNQVPVFNPQGDVVNIPREQLSLALQSGQYQQASPQDVSKYLDEQKYGTIPQQAATIAEHAGEAATFGTSPSVEFATGITTPEAYRKRTETNPTEANIVGPAIGLIGSSFVPGGEGALLEKAGQAGVNALGLGGEGLIAKVGSSAVKNAIEAGLYQAGDENAKLITQDPNQTAQTAIANVGLGALYGGVLGGGIGVVSPLWKATVGDKLGGWLEAIQRRANGDAVELPENVANAIKTTSQGTGFEVSPELKAVMSGEPELAKQYGNLIESKTKPGLDLKASLDNFEKTASEHIVKSLGRDIENVLPTGEISNYEAGTKIQDTLADSIKKVVDPISEQYDNLTKQFDKVPLTSQQDIMADKLANLIEKERWSLDPTIPGNKLANETLKALPNIKTLEDLRKYQSLIYSKAAGNPEMFYPAKQIVGVLRDFENQLIDREASKLDPQIGLKLAEARQNYGAARDVIDGLNDRLHAGKYSGPGTFVNALKEMKPEDILNRLSKPNDAGLIDLLQKEFPEVANQIKEHQLSKVLGQASMKAKEGFPIHTGTFLKAYEKMTPEMRNFVIPEHAQKQISAIQTLMDSLPKYKSSNTAGNLDSLWSKVPGGAMALASMLMGHNPAIGWVLGQTAKWASRDAPDAVRLAMLKFLGSEGEINPSGFKAAVDFIHHTIQGESMTSKAVKSLFEAGRIIIPDSKIPTDKSREKLDEQLQDLQKNPGQLFDSDSQVVHYMPEHGQALAQVAAQGATYLNSVRPKNPKISPLDEDVELSPIQKAKWNRNLDIAHQPLTILQNIKDGTITPEDVIALKSIYPNYYQGMSNKIRDEMINSISDGKDIPYQTRLGLTLFLGQNLDSTITPQAIQATQPSPQGPVPTQSQPKKGPHSMKNIGKMAMSEQTAGQARESSRLKE